MAILEYMKFLSVLLLSLTFIMPANANVFVWEDPEHEITLAYPHDWMYQAIDRQEDIRLHILAPQGQDDASCRVIASNDNRFLYVPPEGFTQVAQFVQDEEALEGLLAHYMHYENVRLKEYRDLATLGKGPATMAVAQYSKNQKPMQAIIFGGYMRGMESYFFCESQVDKWDNWEATFMNLAANFDFPVRAAALKNGYYRDFMADGFVYFPVGNHQGVARY